MTQPVTPQLDRGNIRRQLWTPEYDRFILYPNGWLIGVFLENDPRNPGYMSGDFEITDDNMALFGSFHWEFAMASAGIVFPEPLPNVNAAQPYWLRRGERTDIDGPVIPVFVSTIGVWH